MITKTIKINRWEELIIRRAIQSEGVCVNSSEFNAVRELVDRIDGTQPKGRGRINVYRAIARTCDECDKEPQSKTLWKDRYGNYWCPDCWPYYDYLFYMG